MMKKNQTGLWVTFFTLSSILGSCSQDDDYYKSDMYTLAEKMETRTAEPGGTDKVTLSDTCMCHYTITLSRKVLSNVFSYNADIYVRMYRKNNVPMVELLTYSCSEPNCTVDNVEFQSRGANWGYLLTASGRDIDNNCYSGTLENIIFF